MSRFCEVLKFRLATCSRYSFRCRLRSTSASRCFAFHHWSWATCNLVPIWLTSAITARSWACCGPDLRGRVGSRHGCSASHRECGETERAEEYETVTSHRNGVAKRTRSR